MTQSQYSQAIDTLAGLCIVMLAPQEMHIFGIGVPIFVED